MRDVTRPVFDPMVRHAAQIRALMVRQTENLPDHVQRVLLREYEAGVSAGPYDHCATYKRAGDAVLDVAGKLRAARVGHAYDEAAIRDHAENYARRCGELETLDDRLALAATVGVEPVISAGMTGGGLLLRMADELWWRRQLRRSWTRKAEEGWRALGNVRRGRELYASDEAVRHRGRRMDRTREWMDSRVMVNGEGEQLELLDLYEKSIAAPAIRRTELMVRSRGFDEAAEAAGHRCIMITATAPGAFHPQLSAGGKNPNYNGRTAKEAQQWLCRMWARARAMFKRRSIRVYGIRTVEPHHDGTPHWHMSMYGSEADLELAEFIGRGVWLSEYGDESGAREHRWKVIKIDPTKGSATGYIAKYIAKNIDGHGAIGEEADGEGGQVADNCKRVSAWASAHGIRQFQQFGGPPVGKWRELRRLRDEVAPEMIEAGRAAADSSNWHEYMRLAGEITLVRETVRDGLVVRPACSVNRYGEQRPARVVALRDWHGEVITRPHRWRIERKASRAPCSDACSGDDGRRVVPFSESARASALLSDLGPVAITVRIDPQGPDRSAGMDFSWVATVPFRADAPSLGDPAAWTSRETSTAGPGRLQ